MKKAIFCAIALMVGGMTYAQVTDADGNVSPVTTPVPILGGAAIDANTGLSIQNGDDQRVRVRQAGTYQSVYTNQDNGVTGTGGNQAAVRQTGSVTATSGVANAADVLQSGTTNSSWTRQEGDDNHAVTHQGQTDGTSTNNRAKIRQGTGQQAEDNFAAITQNGVDNRAQTQQTYDNSDAWTQQTGLENKSMIVQDAGPNQTAGHYAMNQQKGERNESFINQQGNGARNTARALQIGNDNQAKQMQTATDGAGGTGNDAGIMQGYENNAQRSAVVPEAMTQWSSIGSNVDANATSFYWAGQPAEYNKAKQTQTGSDNSAGLYQLGGSLSGSNYGEQEQDGSLNNAGMIQSHVPNTGADNYAKQNQSGANNTAGLLQEGTSHKSLQFQDGDDNNSLAFQRGQGHLLNTHQFGVGNTAHSTQSGLENKALIVQHDGQSYSVEQNVGLAWNDYTEGGNQADILQMGPDGDFGAGAVDCAFDAPMDLDMDYDFPAVDLGDICPDC